MKKTLHKTKVNFQKDFVSVLPINLVVNILGDISRRIQRIKNGKVAYMSAFIVFIFFGAINDMTAQVWIMGTGDAANGATIADCSGTFYDSGGSGLAYFNNDNLSLTFTPPSGEVVATFNMFNVENNGPAACYDELRIYDGTSAAATVIGVFCNSNPPPVTITSTLGSLHFVFVSDNTRRRLGWDISISNTDANCGVIASGPVADYTINEGGTINTCTGTFADSGDGSAGYGNNETQSMTFCSDIGNQISFTFEHFNTEAGADILTIYDGADNVAPSLGSFSGFGVANSPGVISSSGTCLTFEFTSNGSTTAPGWLASIKCTGSVPIAATTGTWSGYPEGSACGNNLQIGGSVYEDLDQDGNLDNGESPIKDVTVTLYDDNGQVGVPTTTDTNGEYTFSGLTVGTVYRVEFTIPDGHGEGPQGNGNNTDVQFVNAGSCDANFSLVDANQYCNESNPEWTISCYANGDAQHPSNVNSTAIAKFEYTDSGDSPAITYVNYVSTGAVGSIWGSAYNYGKNTNYYSTVLKRHVGLGPGGIGAIYGHVDGTANSVAPIFYDFGTLAGSVLPSTTRFPENGNAFGQEGPCGTCDNIDPTTFSQIGKVGFGDIDIGPEGQYLYATNLADRKIYKISTDNPAPGSAIPLPGIPWLDNSPCNNGIARPWGLEFRRGKLYVGVVCDASLSTCAIGTACADLTANIYSFDGTTWTNELSFPLDYYRDAWASGSDYFVKWIDDWNTMAPYVANILDANFGQPIIMDIEFDDDNSIIIGIGDRSTFQMGYLSPNPTANSDDISEQSFSFGDILRGSYDIATDTYALENNGSVGGLTTSNPTNNTGPGGKSFYSGDYWTGLGANLHQSGVGGLAMLPCSGEVMFPIGDPIDYYSNGVVWMSNTNGAAVRKMEVYQGVFDGNSPNFAKSAGVGDMELITSRGPIEVGNIVWWDENANGLQDPSELGIQSVTLELWKDNNGTFVKVAETTTDAYGRYVFSTNTNSNGLNAENWSFSADNEVLPKTSYEIRIPNWLSDAGVIAFRDVLGYTAHLLSPLQNQGATGMERDNNGADVSGNALTSLTTGTYSQNDHSYDFAFSGEGGCERPVVVPVATIPCHGEDIIFDLTITGGQSPYDFIWAGPSSFASNIQNPTIANADSILHAGTYTVTVTDALGCVETACVDIAVNGISLSATSVDASCGSGDGSIDLTIDGQPPYIIDWDNDGTGDNDDAEDLIGLAGGTYKVTVTDADGCQSEIVAVVNEAGAPILSVTKVDASCGNAIGSIDLTITGAFTTIDWDNDGTGDNDDTQDLSALAAGTYTVVVTNASGCSAGLSVVIEDTPVPTASTTPVHTVCGNSDGSIDLLVSGGTAPYTYAWSNGASTEDVFDLAAGAYSVVIADANACTTTASETIIDTPGPALTTSPIDESCAQSNGAIDLTITGGTAPFTYAWNNGLSTEDISAIGAGTLMVTVTDANGCVATASQAISNIEGPTLTLTPSNATDCNTADGSIDLAVTGGIPPYSYDWDIDGFGDNDDVEDPTALGAGTYIVSVTDANGCSEIISTSLQNNNDPVLSVSITDPTTCLELGSVDLTITGGIAPFTIDWSNDGLGDNDDTEDLTGLEGGVYQVIVTGADACSAQANVSIRVLRPPVVTPTVVPPSCGNADGSIILAIDDPDGAAPYTFDWDNDGVGDNDDTQDQTSLPTGVYTLTVTNGISCQTITTVELAPVIAAPTVSLLQTNPTCEGDSDGGIDMTITGGTPPYSIDWSNDGTGDNDDTEDLAGLPEGTYSVVVSDNGSCQGVGAATLTGGASPTLNFITTNELCGTVSTGAIDLTISGVAPFTIDWDNDGTGDNDDTEDLSGLLAGTYNLIVSDANACTTTGSIKVLTSAPFAPEIAVIDNDCTTDTPGFFTIITACEAGSSVEWSIDNGSTWSATTPAYDGTNVMTVIARCVSDADNTCSAESIVVISSPTDCCATPPCFGISIQQN